MARFGNQKVIIKEGVKINLENNILTVNGPKGTLTRKIPDCLKINIKDNALFVERLNESKTSLALQGTIRSHIINMIQGVTSGWKKELELVGTGYRAELKGEDLVINIGYSHPVIFNKVGGINFAVTKNIISIDGIDLEKVSQLGAMIRSVRKPDAYQGKGIKYKEEVIKKKPGKQAVKSGA
jgi:large subunit ribosomal protein L6